MPLPSGAVRAANRGGIRHEASGIDDVFIKPLGRRNQDKKQQKIDKLKSAYGSKPQKLSHPAVRRPSTSQSSRPGTASSRPSTAAKADRRGPPPPAPKSSKPRPAPDVLQSFNVTAKIPALAPGAGAGDALARTMQSEKEEHTTMMKILTNRALQLRAAKALRAEGFDAVAQHVVKMDDVTLAVDVLPVITGALESGEKEDTVSLPVLVELLPILRQLVMSTFEDYQIVVLSFINMMLTHWRSELRAATHGGCGMEASISSQGFAVGVCAMSSRIEEIAADRSTKVSVTARKVCAKIDAL